MGKSHQNQALHNANAPSNAPTLPPAPSATCLQTTKSNDQLYTPKHQPFSCGKTTDNNINNIDSNSSTINNHVILPATSPQSSPSKTIPKENNLILISIRKFPDTVTTTTTTATATAQYQPCPQHSNIQSQTSSTNNIATTPLQNHFTSSKLGQSKNSSPTSVTYYPEKPFINLRCHRSNTQQL